MITGMRSWIGAISSFGAAVITQQLSSQSASSAAPGGRQASNRPAKAKGMAAWPGAARGLTYQGCLPPGMACHS
jgi:hypothetical protein